MVAEYEIHHLLVPREVSRPAVRQLLADHAEYDGWELARMRILPDGHRRVTLRRRIIRVAKTLDPWWRPVA